MTDPCQPTETLKSTEMHLLWSWRPEVESQCVCRAVLPLKARGGGGGSFLPFPVLVGPGVPLPVTTSPPRLPPSSCGCPSQSPRLLFLYGHVVGSRARPHPVRAPFSNRVRRNRLQMRPRSAVWGRPGPAHRKAPGISRKRAGGRPPAGRRRTAVLTACSSPLLSSCPAPPPSWAWGPGGAGGLT